MLNEQQLRVIIEGWDEDTYIDLEEDEVDDLVERILAAQEEDENHEDISEYFDTDDEPIT